MKHNKKAKVGPKGVKIGKLREFIKAPPKNWDKLTLNGRFSVAAKASGMTDQSVQVAVYKEPEIRKVFGIGPPRARIDARHPGHAAFKVDDREFGLAGAGAAFMAAMDLMKLDDLIVASRKLRHRIDARIKAGQRELARYK